MRMAPVTYQPVPFSELRGWEQDDHLAALKAFLQSCPRILQAVRGRSGLNGQAVPSPGLLSACETARALAEHRLSPAVAKQFFEDNFTPHKVVHAGARGLLTGYFEPVLAGSRTRQGKFQTPIYKRPPELVNLVDETMRAVGGDKLTHARKTSKGLEPFATRQEIEQGLLAGRGLELLYLADPVDVFFMQIQGSGRIKLPDGTAIRVSYDGKNGHPYTSIGRHLIETGAFPADRMSLDALGKWLRADPERGRQVMWQNRSYVFFRELRPEEAKGPLGALQIPLTPGRSLAVDASVHALGSPVYVDAPDLVHVLHFGGFHRLMIAHDVGSAIKGPERGDIYFGSGPSAGKLASVTRHPGRFFVLLPVRAAHGSSSSVVNADKASAAPRPKKP